MTRPSPRVAALAELGRRISEATDVEEVVDVALLGLDQLLGHPHSLLLLHQVESDQLVTLSSRGYEEVGIGSEVRLGEGVIGMAAERRQPMRIGNLQRMLAYARTVQQGRADEIVPGTEIRLPGLADARSQLAAPMITRGTLVGVVAVESSAAVAFDEDDEHALAVVASLVGAVLEREHLAASEPDVAKPTAEPAAVVRPSPGAEAGPPAGADDPARPPVRLRHYSVDGSTFLDDAYVIKGVAGRLLWKLASEHEASGRTSFTNREARLDPALELPAFRDNFESRLILLKRRLDERGAPLRIRGAGRGRFELEVHAPVALERIGG